MLKACIGKYGAYIWNTETNESTSVFSLWSDKIVDRSKHWLELYSNNKSKVSPDYQNYALNVSLAHVIYKLEVKANKTPKDVPLLVSKDGNWHLTSFKYTYKDMPRIVSELIPLSVPQKTRTTQRTHNFNNKLSFSALEDTLNSIASKYDYLDNIDDCYPEADWNENFPDGGWNS
jgi:hypothetical protein